MLVSNTPTHRPLYILVLVKTLLNQVIFDAIEPSRKLELIIATRDRPLREIARLVLRRFEVRLGFVGVGLPRRARWSGLTPTALLLCGRHIPVRGQFLRRGTLPCASLIQVMKLLNAGAV